MSLLIYAIDGIEELYSHFFRGMAFPWKGSKRNRDYLSKAEQSALRKKRSGWSEAVSEAENDLRIAQKRLTITLAQF